MQSVAGKFQRSFCVGFVSLAVISIPSATLAVPVEQVPNPRQVNGTWVTDMADILSPATEAELNQMINQLEAKNGSEIAVVTVPETSPSATPKQFATTLFNQWHIGKAGKDNGVLFLISKGERRVEIETGYGVESILPNALVGDIISQEITPQFSQGDYNGGAIAGTKALVVKLETNNPPANLTLEQPWYAQIPWYAWLGGVGGVVVVLWAVLRRRRSGSSGCDSISDDSSYDSGSGCDSSSYDSGSDSGSGCDSSSYDSGSYDSGSGCDSSSYDSGSSYDSSSYDSGSNYSSSSSDSGSSYSSSSSDSGSSYSSSDFGGGSSGGGGAGDSW